MRLVDVTEAASVVAGFAVGVIITTELFYNQVGTITQIAAMALSTLILATEISSRCNRFSKFKLVPDSFKVTLLFAVCFGVTGGVLKLGALTDSAYYQTCPSYQPHYWKECDRILDTCESKLSKEEWKGDFEFGYSPNGQVWYSKQNTQVFYCADGMSKNRYEDKKLAIKFLCSQILFPSAEVMETNDKSCYPAWHLSPEARRQITVYKRELYEITQCDPKIKENPFFKADLVIRSIAVMTPIAAVAKLFND